jgi:hypothetical protein
MHNDKAKQIAEKAGKKILRSFTFEGNNKDFEAIGKAEKWCADNKYIVGSMCRGEPIGIALESDCSYIAKWRNIDPSEYSGLGGVIITHDNMRMSDCTVYIFG